MTEEKPAKSGPLARLRQGLSRSREALRTGFSAIFRREIPLSPENLEELEGLLLQTDLGPAVTERLVKQVRRSAEGAEGSPLGRALVAVRRELETILSAPAPGISSPGTPRVVLVIGVNGTGKTTTVAKLAHRWRGEGRRVLVAAADTYRAAAIDQLALWAERAGVDLVRQRSGADPAAVAFDAAEAAVARGADILLVDTAGRLHTREDLRAELGKIARVLAKKVPGAPHEVLLVLDATTGQTALAQAELFRQTVPLSGIVVTKLDGTARAGIVVAIRERLGIPVQYVGVGEGIEDLQDFDAASFAEALLGGAGEPE